MVMEFPFANYYQTITPLIRGGVVREKEDEILLIGDEERKANTDAIEIMLKIETEKIDLLQKGTYPFVLTFFRNKEERLWRYDICVVPKGREAAVSALLEGMYAKYRVIVFVLEDPEQRKELYVSCEYCFVWKEDGEYHFFKEIKQNE